MYQPAITRSPGSVPSSMPPADTPAVAPSPERRSPESTNMQVGGMCGGAPGRGR